MKGQNAAITAEVKWKLSTQKVNVKHNYNNYNTCEHLKIYVNNVKSRMIVAQYIPVPTEQPTYITKVKKVLRIEPPGKTVFECRSRARVM